ncbi:hemolysin family protein [Fictibacillus sp. WQ 8-8]|uniref:hemolysin family protein n=1 Tax=unclassified Fictibacillus TaxID=2644029 RepID=UPI0006A7A39E|nr:MULTISPECIES: hemolysin family protein [unclassified Fictibacillus]MCQ6267108.1 hemolysin family protein [Fictibacillus sp. WQ 8-8]MED2972115.1 hemolysin family protein [Fictibacillus sp. B-59209]UZJ78273.1 hemolysin family protein [Fictibacillus sp. KU28468]
MDIFKLFVVALLIVLTAFFVAAEFAIVKIRRTRIDQLVEEGNKKAIAVRKVLLNLDGYLSACQLGITITALGLGWLGEGTLHHLLQPVFEQLSLSPALTKTVTLILAFAIITFLHVVLGELAPKTFAIQKAEEISLMLSGPLILFYRVLYPVIWVLNGSARLLTKMFGLSAVSEHEMAHSEEELRLILSESYKSGEINQSEYSYVNKVFEFDDRIAKEIMVPRTEIVCLYINKSIEENLSIITSEKYTRYPVVDEDKDHVVGMVNVKEIFYDLMSGVEKSLESYLRPILTVIETIPIQETLVKLQKQQVHMAVLMDEYGGTAGLLTVEDILEEIVGEIRDEFDTDETPMILKVTPRVTVLDGKVLISEVNDLYGLDIDDSDLDTIGGWMLSQNSDIVEGDEIEYEGLIFKVVEIDGHQIKRIEVSKIEISKDIEGSVKAPELVTDLE